MVMTYRLGDNPALRALIDARIAGLSEIEIARARQEAVSPECHRHCWHASSAAAACNHEAKCCVCSIESTPTVPTKKESK